MFSTKQMWDFALSIAYTHLLPLARNHWRDHWLPLLKKAPNMIRFVPRDIAELKVELGTIEDFINNADRKADSVEDKKMSHAIKAKIKQLVEASFHIEDVIDEYMIHEEQQLAGTGFAAGGANFMKTCWYWICCCWCYWILRLQIAYKIQNIKSRLSGIKDHDFQIQSSLDTTSSSSATNRNTVSFPNLQKAPSDKREADVVGFKKQRRELIHWLIKGREELTSICVVGMAGQGKTTLVKKVFDNNEVVGHFRRRVWITLSPSYNGEDLLKDMLRELYKQDGKHPDQSFQQMNRESLVEKVTSYLQGKRYVVVFDDVWNLDIWAEIKFAMIDNKNGSKILITTRNENVEKAVRGESLIEVCKLKPLDKKQSLKLFNKKAFNDLNGCCPENLINISSEIVEKCKGLPLAIVTIGGILSSKDRNRSIVWYKFSKNIKAELKEDAMIRKILVLSYHDLPYNLKSCFLYFGLYPEDYIVHSKTLTRQWIAEGFVKEEKRKTLEEVAEGYLEELIHRSLVQAVSIRLDNSVISCRVHDLVHAMILEKHEDIRFCKNITEDKHLSLTGMFRRLSISSSSDNLIGGIESSHVRSLLVLEPQTSVKSFIQMIPTKYRRLKVLALLHKESLELPNDLGSLNHLKYFGFSLNEGSCCEPPKSIGMLVNLQTLDLRHTEFENNTMPKEICKLKMLRHFIGYCMSLIQLKDGIGGMTSLQTLKAVHLDDGEDENDNRVVELIQELGKLNQLREFVLEGVRSKYMSAISSSINKMQQMEKLRISGVKLDTFIDLDLNTPPHMLQRVKLEGHLKRLPEWIPKLENLVKLEVTLTNEVNDAMKLLQSMPSLLFLHMYGGNYKDKFRGLRFQDGWFMNLKELHLEMFYNLRYILINKFALHSLKMLDLTSIPQIRRLPNGIQHLQNLEHLRIVNMSEELIDSIDNPDEGEEHRFLAQVPFVEIVIF